MKPWLLRWQFLVGVVALLEGVSSAYASESLRPQVEVVCDELSQETRAAIEVRQIGDMADLRATSGTLRLTCHTDAVIGEWLEAGVVIQRRNVSRGPTDSPTELLHWIASLLIDGRRQPDETPTAVPSVDSPAQDSNPEPTRVAQALPSPPASEPETPPITSEPAVPPAPLAEAPSPWGGSLGVRYQHWGQEIAGSVGPLARVEYSLVRAFSGVVAASWLWGTNSAGRRLEANEGSLSAGVAYDILDEWSVGVAVALAVLALRTTESAPVRVFEVLPALDVTTQVGFPAPEWGVYFEAGLRAVPVSREVRLDDVPALHVPEVRALFSIGAIFSPP